MLVTTPRALAIESARVVQLVSSTYSTSSWTGFNASSKSFTSLLRSLAFRQRVAVSFSFPLVSGSGSGETTIKQGFPFWNSENRQEIQPLSFFCYSHYPHTQSESVPHLISKMGVDGGPFFQPTSWARFWFNPFIHLPIFGLEVKNIWLFTSVRVSRHSL